MSSVSIDIIKNGSFSKVVYIEDGASAPIMYPFENWINDTEWIYDDEGKYVERHIASQGYDDDTDEPCCNISTQNNGTIYSDLYTPPGIHQILDLTQARDDSTLDLEFYAKSLSGDSYAEIWIHKLKSYDDEGYYEVESLVDSEINSLSSDWKKIYYSNYDLDAGVYLLSITGRKNDNSWLKYEFQIKNIESVFTQDIIPYSNLLKDGDFKASSSTALSSNWTIGGPYVCPIANTTNGEADYSCHMKSIDDEYNFRYGRIEQEITISYEHFWADFSVSIIDGDWFEDGVKSNNEKYCIDVSLWKGTTGQSEALVWSSTISCMEKWYKKTISLTKTIGLLYAGTYTLIITPANSNKYSNKYNIVLDDVSFNAFAPYMTLHTGTFDNPYTIEDGRLLHDYSSNEFVFFNGLYPENDSFAFIDGDYYAVSSTGCFPEGIHTVQDKTFYTYPDGRIAISEKFIYEDKIYQANAVGEITYLCDKITSIDLLFKGNIVNLRTVEAPFGIVELEANFTTQSSSVTLDVYIPQYDAETVSVSSITPGKNKNIIKLNAYYGEARLYVSYYNSIDKTTVETMLYLNIVQGQEYEEELSLNIISDVHYVALDSSLTIPYVIKPNLACTIDVDWLSSDESVALVDVFGNILPRGLGTCTIKAINYNANISDTCTLHVVEETTPPNSISLSDYSVDIGISDTAFISSTVLNADGTTLNVNQEVKWESEDSKIAIVDNYGYITGVNEGTTHVYCYSYDNRSIRSTVEVNVSGEVTAIKEIELNMYEAMLPYNNRYPIYEYIGVSFIPSNTNQKEVVWSSSDPDTVKVAINGRLSVGDNPQVNVPIYIKCTSVSNPEIYRECIVTVVDIDDFIPTITLQEDSVRTYAGKKVNIYYGITQGYYADASLEKIDGTSSSNIVSNRSNYVEITTMEAGEYILTLTASGRGGETSKTCEVVIYEADEEPQFAEVLDLLYAFQDGSYVLRYFAVDSDDDLNLTHYINVDDDDYYSSVKPELLLYNGDEYYYIFGYDLDAGTHTAKIKVIDSDGYETISNSVSLTIPANVDNKTTLKNAKDSYDEIKIDLITCLNDIIEDGKMGLDEKREFTTRYKMFNVGYENLLDILDYCVKYINSQIETSQVEMATLADALASDGAAVATYSEGDYTNSNFDSVTDMDYYQNECIKALVQRVLELEARLDELSNNNN